LLVEKTTCPETDAGVTVAVHGVAPLTSMEEEAQDKTRAIWETWVTDRLVVPELAVLEESPE